MSDGENKKYFDNAVLETKRLILRPLEISDAEQMYSLASVPIVGERTGWKPHESVNETRKLLSDLLISPNNRAIVIKESGVLAGVIGLMDARVENHSEDMEIGYWLGVPFWGNGIMPEAVRAAVDYVFRALGVKAIWIRCKTDNHNSKRVAEKCGFTYSHTASGERANGAVADFFHFRLDNPNIQ